MSAGGKAANVSPSFIEPNVCYISSVTSVNLKKAGMASRNIVIKNNTRCYWNQLCSSFFGLLVFGD